MKNKSIGILVALIAVVLVGGAVYFGDSSAQKGTIALPFRPKPTASCGAVWTKVAELNSSGFTNGTFEKLYDTAKRGCDVKVNVTLSGSDQFYSFSCADVFSGTSAGAGQKLFWCLSGDAEHNKLFEYSGQPDGTTWLTFNQYVNKSSTDRNPLGVSGVEIFSK